MSEEVEVVEEKKTVAECPTCEMKTPHWELSNGNVICGFCGTEH